MTETANAKVAAEVLGAKSRAAEVEVGHGLSVSTVPQACCIVEWWIEFKDVCAKPVRSKLSWCSQCFQRLFQ